MTERPTIMLVDDEVANIEILNAALEDHYELCFATSGREALELARNVFPDLILLDVIMPEMDGYEVCRQLKADPLVADVPIIFTTAMGEQEAEIRGLEAGAIDYVTKPISPSILQARVRNHIDLKRLRDELAELAVTDALTGLSNRRRLEESLKVETARLAREAKLLSVIILDIDFFKQFNDTYGHPAGDRCIAMVAAALNRAVRRAADVTARYGGEEFACVLPGLEHQEAMDVAQNIRNQVYSLSIPHQKSSAADFVTVSVGVATAMCLPGATPDFWLHAADAQLYLAKRSGRNNVCGMDFSLQPSVEHAASTGPLLALS